MIPHQPRITVLYYELQDLIVRTKITEKMTMKDSEFLTVIIFLSTQPSPTPHLITFTTSHQQNNKTMTLSKNNSAGSSSAVHKKALVNKDMTLPSSGRKPGYFTKEDIDELTDISTSDVMLAFGDECVELYGVEEQCRELFRKEKEQIKKDNEREMKESVMSLEELLLE